ncbi:MAG: CoA-binding protein [Bacteroidia bacterium]|nr:CoA-binding protein [Bacteroidia bacterium]
MKKTLVLGASENPQRYAYLAVEKLKAHGHPVIAVSLKAGNINGTEIHAGQKHFDGVDTVTLYVGTANQPSWYDYILSLNPKRIIFNPGTENAVFEKMANEKGIETTEACTLVMLSVGNY